MVYWTWPLLGQPAAWQAVLGGAILHLSLGTLYLWGNIGVYVTSYLRHAGGGGGTGAGGAVTAQDALSVYSAALLGQAVALLAGAPLRRRCRLSERALALAGGALFSCATLASAFVTTLSGLIATYGVMFGMGIGLAYTAPLAVGFRWLPRRRGLVSGCVVAGFGGGAFVFNFVATAYVNPHNISPVAGPDGMYFGPEVAERVPGMFLLLGACHLVLTTAGAALMRSPPPTALPPAPPLQASPAHHQRRSVVSDGYSSSSIEVEGALFEDKEAAGAPGRRGYQQLGGGDADGDTAALSKPDYEPAQLPCVLDFWLLSVCMLLTAVGGLLVGGTYKRFGQAYFRGDTYLTTVGSLSSVANAGGRVLWGLLGDRAGPYWALALMAALMAALLASYHAAAASRSEAAFAIWTCAIFGVFGGNFALYPVAAARALGAAHAGANYSSVFAGYTCGSFVALLALARAADAAYPLAAVASGVGAVVMVAQALRCRNR